MGWLGVAAAFGLFDGRSDSGHDDDATGDIDDVAGSDGNDMLSGAAWTVLGFGGDDDLTLTDATGFGGDGNDRLSLTDRSVGYGGSGADVLTVSANGGMGYGGADNDTLSGVLTSQDALFGGAGDDMVTGGATFGGGGNDTVSGLLNVDGGAGDDVLSGVPEVCGGTGDDLRHVHNGGDNNDTGFGRGGNDTLIAEGNAKGASLSGGAGNDLILFDATSTTDARGGLAGELGLCGAQVERAPQAPRYQFIWLP